MDSDMSFNAKKYKNFMYISFFLFQRKLLRTILAKLSELITMHYIYIYTLKKVNIINKE